MFLLVAFDCLIIAPHVATWHIIVNSDILKKF